MRIVVIVVILIEGLLLGLNYSQASIGELDAFVDATAASEPACVSPAVVAAIERSWAKSRRGRDSARLMLVRAFSARNDGPEGHADWMLRTLARGWWLRATRGSDAIAAAICANGVAGRDDNLPRIGAMVGVGDIARADPRVLQALSDVYVLDLHYRAPPDRIRGWYAARMRNAVDNTAPAP